MNSGSAYVPIIIDGLVHLSGNQYVQLLNSNKLSWIVRRFQGNFIMALSYPYYCIHLGRDKYSNA